MQASTVEHGIHKECFSLQYFDIDHGAGKKLLEKLMMQV